MIEAGFSVLLIEAGGSDILSEFLNPVAISATFPNLLGNSQADWNYKAKMTTFDGFSQEIDYPRYLNNYIFYIKNNFWFQNL